MDVAGNEDDTIIFVVSTSSSLFALLEFEFEFHYLQYSGSEVIYF